MTKTNPKTSASWPIRRMSHIVDRHLENISRALRPLGLTAPMWRVLNGLHEGGASSVGDLALHSAFERSYVSRLVTKLSELGLVEAKGDKTDRRFVHVSLTREGRLVHKKALEIVLRLNQQSLTALSETEAQQLSDLLSRVSDSIGAQVR
jgi:MarR family transcriptional regulator, organic hydroperoxide resistance regulator